MSKIHLITLLDIDVKVMLFKHHYCYNLFKIMHTQNILEECIYMIKDRKTVNTINEDFRIKWI